MIENCAVALSYASPKAFLTARKTANVALSKVAAKLAGNTLFVCVGGEGAGGGRVGECQLRVDIQVRTTVTFSDSTDVFDSRKAQR